MKNSMREYRGRVIATLVAIQFFALSLVVTNPQSDLVFWSKAYIGHNDFLWYLIAFIALVLVFVIAGLIDKALFIGLDENN